MGFWRGFTGTAAEIEHGGHRYTVDLKIFTLGRNLALYRDGELIERASSPQRFEIADGAVIEVDSSEYGFNRAILHHEDGRTPLRPARGTWEDLRRRWGERHPVTSRVVGIAAAVVVVVSLVLGLMELLELLTGADWAQGLLGGWSISSPVDLPPWFLWVFGLVVGAATLERALRMK